VTGTPTKYLYTVLGALTLQQFHNLTDAQVVRQLAYYIQWHYALDLYKESDQIKYICEKTLWNMRFYATTLGIDIELFDLCPADHELLVRRKNKNRYSQGFEKDICCKCPPRNGCPTKQGKRYFYLR
jgi:hypothetical protein